MQKESAKNLSSFAPAKSRAITVKVTVTSDYGKEIVVEEEFNVPRGQRLLSAEMLDLMIQLGANRAHTAAEEEYALYDYYSAGIEAPSFRLRAIQTEVADSYAAGDFYVHRGWDDPFYEYTFAGGTKVESEIPLDLEEFYKIVR